MFGDHPTDIVQASNHIDQELYKYTGIKSKWSGNTIIVPRHSMKGTMGRKEWSCDITCREDATTKAIIHEHLHARSVSYFNELIYMQNQTLEESTVELFATEICKTNHVKYTTAKAYADGVRALKAINNIAEIENTSYDFAKKCLKSH